MTSSRNTQVLSDRIDVSSRKGWSKGSWKRELIGLLPAGKYNFQNTKLELFIRVGYSNTKVDPWSVVPDFKEALVNKYGLVENHIYRIVTEKELVLEGMEYLEFRISRIEGEMVLRPYWEVQ